MSLVDHQVPVRIRNRDQFFHCVLIYAIISTNCSCFLFLFFINTTFFFGLNDELLQQSPDLVTVDLVKNLDLVKFSLLTEFL